MRRFILGWKELGHEQRLDARLVNYADDFVICCRGSAEKAMAVMRNMMSKLKLTVNEKKTRLCRLVRQDKSGCSRELKGVHLEVARSSCSRLSERRSDPSVEASKGEDMSRKY
jgi:RNA-directed DNA polymerase